MKEIYKSINYLFLYLLFFFAFGLLHLCFILDVYERCGSHVICLLIIIIMYLIGIAVLSFDFLVICVTLKNIWWELHLIIYKRRLKKHPNEICYECEKIYNEDELVHYENMNLCKKCYELYTGEKIL